MNFAPHVRHNCETNHIGSCDLPAARIVSQDTRIFVMPRYEALTRKACRKAVQEGSVNLPQTD